MRSNDELRDQISKTKLMSFFDVHGEGDSWDCKATLATKKNEGKPPELTSGARAELARDILALAHTPGGGHLVLGITKNYEPQGLGPDMPAIQTEFIAEAIAKFHRDVRILAAEYVIEHAAWDGKRRFGLIYVAESEKILLPLVAGNCQNERGEQVCLFKPTDILVRRNAQTCCANQDDLVRLHLKNAEPEKAPLFNNLPGSDQIAPDFVGRTEELTALRTWFGDPYSRVWLLSGDGGKGKTAIAYRFACEVQVTAPTGYEAVIWLSAKRRAFIEGSTQPLAGPDFWDLRSLVDAVNRAYGYDFGADKPFDEVRGHAIELLTHLPSLLIIDDIDSVAPEHENTFTFLMGLMRTPTKILFTSRRILFGMNGTVTQVRGFSDHDSVAFIDSRIRRLRLEPSLFNHRIKERILKATDGSPLFIEDLLRLCASKATVDQAISQWEKKSGDAAREYALRRELETLAAGATDILITCSLYDGPVSFAEIQSVTGFPEQQVSDNLDALQHLFLVSYPRLVEDVQRFDVLLNTRILVRAIYSDSDRFRRLAAAFKQLQGQAEIAARREVGAYIRQATAQQALGQDEEAERTIKSALDRYPEQSDLIAQLGIIYLRWPAPARKTDARLQFERAAQLHCARETMYDHWSRMEAESGEFSDAARVAQLGRTNAGDTMTLLYREGYARSRLGQELRRGFLPERAEQELREADKLLLEALKDPHMLAGPYERQLNRRIFMALVLNYEALGQFVQMHKMLDRWESEHPDDPPPHDLIQRLRGTYPSVARRPTVSRGQNE